MATDIIARGLASKANNSIEGIKVGGSPYIGDNGNWYVWDSGTSAYKDSNIKAEGVNGEPGKDGITPHIGKNGNWYIGDVDTGISATGYTTVPIASATTLGGIKVGENLTIAEDGTLNAQASAEDVIIIYKSFSDYTEEEKTNVANNLLSCVDSNNSLVKICYLDTMDMCFPLTGIVSGENYIKFIFLYIEGFSQIQVDYTMSTTSNTLINVTLNMYNLVDSAMSDTSTKPVQNKVIKQYVDNLVGNIETVLQTINSGSGV